MTETLRNEWGFEGLAITDQASFEVFAYEDLRAGLAAGTDLWLNTDTELWKLSSSDMNDTIVAAMQRAAKNIVFAISRSNAMNGLSSSSQIVQITPLWQVGLYILDVVLLLAALAGAVLATSAAVKGGKNKLGSILTGICAVLLLCGCIWYNLKWREAWQMYTHVLFDLDGTLTDPAQGITNSVAYALKYYGINEDPKKLTPFIGPPLHESFMEFYGFDREKAMEAVSKYREYFADRGIFENELYPDTVMALETLKTHGCRIGLATSKPQVFAEKILRYFNIDHYFDAVTGSFLDGRRTKKVEVVEEALKAFNHPSKDTVIMVGDRKHDIEGAKENGIACVGVTFGYGSREELTAAGAEFIADDFGKVLNVIL